MTAACRRRAALALFLSFPLLAISEAKDLLWLPLGDSITWGCGTEAAPRGGPDCCATCGGYRVPLAWALSQAGYNVSTMGTLKSGPEYVPEQWIHHEGHPGSRFDNIDDILNKSMATSTTPPDLVTIHLGTNDCATPGLAVSVIENNAHTLLRHVFEKAPNATVYMASMIGFPLEQNCTSSFNALVPGIVAAHKAKGMKILYTCATPVCNALGLCDFLSLWESQLVHAPRAQADAGVERSIVLRQQEL
eukprot:SAG31_NODE_473_length_15222_cov_4.788005_2_plen_248_part_00